MSPWDSGFPQFRVYAYILPKPVIYVSPSLGCVCLSLQPGYKAGLLVAGSRLFAHNRRAQAWGGGPTGEMAAYRLLPPTWLSLVGRRLEAISIRLPGRAWARSFSVT